MRTGSSKQWLLYDLVNVKRNGKKLFVDWKGNAKKDISADKDKSIIPIYLICQVRHIKRFMLTATISQEM